MSDTSQTHLAAAMKIHRLEAELTAARATIREQVDAAVMAERNAIAASVEASDMLWPSDASLLAIGIRAGLRDL